MMYFHSYRYKYLVIVTTLLVLLAICLSFLPYDTAFHARGESGFIEIFTLIMYAVAILICLTFYFKSLWKRGIICAFFLAVLMMREWDFHARFTVEHITSIRYWRSLSVPLAQKLIVVFVLLFFLLIIIYFLKATFKPFLNDLLNKEGYAVSLLSVPIYIIPSLIIDAAVDPESLDTQFEMFCLLLEESLELGIPVIIIIALLQWKHKAETNKYYKQV